MDAHQVEAPRAPARRVLVPPHLRQLMVVYVCPACHRAQALNAYHGPPTCYGARDARHDPEPMVAERLAP